MMDGDTEDFVEDAVCVCGGEAEGMEIVVTYTDMDPDEVDEPEDLMTVMVEIVREKESLFEMAADNVGKRFWFDVCPEDTKKMIFYNNGDRALFFEGGCLELNGWMEW